MKKIILTLCAIAALPVLVKAAPVIGELLLSEERYEIVITEKKIQDADQHFQLKIASKEKLKGLIENGMLDFEYYIASDRLDHEENMERQIREGWCTDNPDRVREFDDFRPEDFLPLCEEYEAPAEVEIKQILSTAVDRLSEDTVICLFNENLAHENFAEIPHLDLFEISNNGGTIQCPTRNTNQISNINLNTIMNTAPYETKFIVRYGHLEIAE